ncbi:MAG: filamentous hemagglutinin N-terminal domain-containing protein, partial [Pseudomonadota bacterium]
MFKHATLNRAYRLVWSELRNTWIAVAEFARTRGKRASGAVAMATALALGAAAAMAAGEPSPTALPTNGQVVAGQVGISSSGARMDVTQGSNSAIVNWDSFNIGSQAHVNFAQPDASAVILNRASGGSAIFGRITANGNVFIVDPGGILFAPGAQVDVGGLVASSLGVSDANFLAGKYQFERVGAGGTVVNQGRLTAADGGFVALIAPQVSNSGTITATNGSVGLAAGDSVNLDFDHDGLLSFQVNVAAAAARADNSGVIVADGGRVVMNAQAKDALLSTVLNNDGVIRARSLESRNGEIWLGGGSSGVVSVTGTLDASGTEAGQAGGTVKVLGDKVGLFAQAKIDVSGVGAGGTALVGGNWQGKGPEQNASATYVGKDVSINADGVGAGDGGKVIVWADDVTRFYGGISAQGGFLRGDGGFVETSGKGALAFNGSVSTKATNGRQGSLLLDPTDLTISDTASGTGSLDTQFDTTTPGTIAFGDGGAADTVSAGALELLAAGTDIDLQATNSITIAALTSAGKGGVEAELTLDQTGAVKFRTGAGGFSMAATDTINVTGAATLSIDAIAATSGGTGDGTVSVGTIRTLGSVSLKGTTVTLSGDITTTDTDLTIGGNLVIAEAASPTLSTGAGTAGNILITGTTNGTAGG